MPQVSVIVPVYNIEAHLRECLDSIVAQTLKDIEIICVDDGSTDDSPAILAEHATRDARFQIITQPNAGPGVARNTGMAHAVGEYIIFLDSDDWFEADFLEQMVTQAEATGSDMTICRAVEFDTNTGKELLSDWMLKKEYLSESPVFSPAEIFQHLFQFTYGWPWDKLYRTNFLQKYTLFYPSLRNSEDLVFVFQSLALAERISVVPRVLVHHRVNRMSSVSNSRRLWPEEPYRAAALLKEGLRQRGVYAAFECSYLNWAMEFLIWNVVNMGNREAQRSYFQKLKREWILAMDFDAHGRRYYESGTAYAKYCLVRYAPYPVFSLILRSYKGLKRVRR